MNKQAVIERITKNFPQELQVLHQWVVWRIETRKDKPTKVPYSISGIRAESDNPTTWTSFDAACKAYLHGNFSGIGFMFSEHDPYAGVDFDKCVLGNNEIEPSKLTHIVFLDSYTEYSQSGTGIHVIVRATLPPGGRKSNQHSIEMYDHKRFFVVTGDVLGGFPATINDRQTHIEHLHALVFPAKLRQAQLSPLTERVEVPLDDQALLDKMFASKNGADIRALWNGSKSAHNGDESAADLALCNHLAFWTGNDAGRMDNLFRQSRLYRDKWGRNARTGEKYGEGTIARAIAATAEVYTPGRLRSAGDERQVIDPATGAILPLSSVKPTTYTNGTNGHGPMPDDHDEYANNSGQTQALTEDDNLFLSLEDILDGLLSLRGNTELLEADRKASILRDFIVPISNLEQHFHVEIENILADKRFDFTRTEAKQFLKSCVSLRKRRDKEEERNRQLEAHQKRAKLSVSLTQKFGGHEIQTNNRQIKEVGDQAMAAIVAKNAKQPKQPVLYVKGGMLARVARDEDDLHFVQTATPGSIYVVLGDVARWINIREGINGEERSDVFPPQAVAQYIHNGTDWPGIPAIESVVNTPVFSRDGVFHTDPGYNSRTRLYYTGGVDLGDTTPTPDNIDAAKSLIIGNLLLDFPFKDDASHANAIAYLLLPFVRQMIDGPTPLHMVESPTPGTGKGKLVNVCAFVALGHDAPTMSEVENDAEWRKALTSFLMTGKTHLCIDNVNHSLDSGVLANALTQPYWSDRVLGANRDINIKISAIWSATGNNVPISEEIARRCVLIRLDANSEKPWERIDFKHKNLMEWTRNNRDILVTACCTFVRAWIEKGRPPFSGRTKGSYESWATVMGGILEAVGIVGFLENENEMFSKTVSANELMTAFIKGWWDKFHEGRAKDDYAVSSTELFKLASYSDDDAENKIGDWSNLLGDMLGTGRQHSRLIKLGMILTNMTDKVIGNYKICQRPIKGGRRMYILQKV